MRKPSQVFVHVVPGKSQNVLTDSDQIQSTNAFKPSCVRAGKLGKAVLLLTTFFICGLVPFSLSASAVPVGVSASDGEFQDIIRLTWEDVADETSYQVFRCDSDISTSCGSATELPADTIQFDDIGNEIVGGYHYYRVKSCIDAVCSDFSATDSGYTQLMFGSGLEADTIAVTSFTINDVSNITLLPLDTANLDWSTGNAQDCVATSSPNLDVWNQAISISTYGPKTISLSADTAGGTYVLDLSCMSVLGMEAGKQVILTVTTEPEAPALIDALGLDKRAVLVFSARGTGGSAITGYTAKCGAFSNTGEASPISVDGLTNGTEYSCSVIATNEIGDSLPSIAVPVTPMTVPDAPVLNSAVAGAESAELFFTSGGNGGDPITGFKAYCGQFSAVGESSPITVNGLTNGNEYSCVVVAINGNGESELSNVELVTPESVPDAPALDSITGGDGSATLFFTATFDGGSAITGYKVECDEFSNDGTSSPITVSGLTNGTEYSCSVIASNKNGPSAPSDPLSVTPSESVSITSFQLTTNKGNQPISCGNVEVTLTWEVENESTCYGSWRENKVNPLGDLTSLTSPDTVLIEDLALNEQFKLRCTDGSPVPAEQSLNLNVKAPCLPTAIRQWDEVFPFEWPYPKSYQVVKQIPEPTNLAIKFNTANISIAGAVGTIEYSSTRGDRLVAISTKPGDYQVADECREFQFIDGNLIWETGDTNLFPDACKLQANTTYYWNTTFSDGINAGSGTCTGTPCITYMNTVAARTWSVGGTVSGLTGGLALQNNGADALAVTADGSFTFSTELLNTSTYAVTVLTQPTGQTCSVTNGSGTIATADVKNVTVTCETD